MKAFILVISILGSFIGMELASWFMHKYIMHGPLWNIHKTHHQHHNQKMELNDIFALFFAAIAMAMLVVGLGQGNMIMTGAGIGISLYGFVYFVLHDIFIHKRIRFFRKSNNRLLKAITEAHSDHHKSRERDQSTSYGLLLIDKKYFKRVNASKRKNT